jgi:hypothetical protein
MRTRLPSIVTATAPIALAALLAGTASAAEDSAGSSPAAETSSGGFAPAADAGGFGAAGQLALSLGPTADEHFFFHKNGGAWQLQLAPAADYFIAPHISVGGVVTYAHASGGPGTNGLGADTFGLAARAGYVLAINDKFGVWPLGGLALTYLSVNHMSQTDTWFTIFAPVLFHPAPHFFVGLGPNFRIHLSGHDSTEYGVDSMLGGWF